MSITMARSAFLAIAAWATMACAPGEIERRLTEYPLTSVCSAVATLPYPVCGEVKDGKQDCHLEWRPAPCDPLTPTVTVICLPADAAKSGVQ